jgi:iron complex outermembrane receptor protein
MLPIARMLLGACGSIPAAAFAQNQPEPAEANSQNPPKEQTSPANAASNLPPATEAASSLGKSDEIVITAQRREESLQRVPIAVTAISGKALDNLGVTDLAGLADRIPSVNLGQQIGGAKITIRGIGIDTLAPGAEAPIAYHVDGVFVQRTAASQASFFDIARVEVLRGPQGTLYGRNATGGAINVISNTPTDHLDGYLLLSGGNYGLYGSQGAISGPIANGIQARFAFRTLDRNGYGKNIVTGHDIDDQHEKAVRGIIDIEPFDRLKIELAGDYTHANDHASGYHYLGQGGPVPLPLGVIFGGFTAPNFRDMAADHDPQRKIDAWGLRGTATYDLGFATFRSITAWRSTKYLSTVDLDNTSFQLFSPLGIHEHGKQFSQEFQLVGDAHNLNWLLGLYHFNENDPAYVASPVWNGFIFPPAVAYVAQGFFSGSFIHTRAEAIFGQATYHFTDKLSATVGGRWSTEQKRVIDQQSFDILTPAPDPDDPFKERFNPAAGIECSDQVQSLPTCVPKKRWSAFTPRFAIEYQATPSTMLYASASKGFRSGTYSLGAVQAPVDPEFVWAYEAGVKSRLFDNALRANLAGFYYDYSDLQVTKAEGTNTVVENAATARVYGLEAELTARPIENLQFDLTGSYLNAKFTEFVSSDPARPNGDGHTFINGQPAFDLAGNTLPQAPRLSFLAGAQYDVPSSIGNISLRGEVSHASTIYFSAFNRPEVSVGPQTRFNAYLNWESLDHHWTAALIGRNLTNKVRATNAYVSTALTGYVINANIEPPRTVQLTVGYHF